MNKKIGLWFVILYGSILLLPACGTQSGTNPKVMASIATQVAQAVEMTRTADADQAERARQTEMAASLTPSLTSTASATATEVPTETPTASPTSTETPTPTPTETLTPTTVPWGYIPENAIIFYLTSVGTGGPIGCGDSLVKLSTGQIRTGNLAADLKVALDAIFRSGHYVGGLYNATYPSSLQVGGVDFNQTTGVAIVQLSGSYSKPESACDASRYRSQVWGTALQFDEIARFIPWVGNSLLGDRLAVYSDGN